MPEINRYLEEHDPYDVWEFCRLILIRNEDIPAPESVECIIKNCKKYNIN